MFEIFPNPVFVADPNSGSIHNRGGAIDVSISRYVNWTRTSNAN